MPDKLSAQLMTPDDVSAVTVPPVETVAEAAWPAEPARRGNILLNTVLYIVALGFLAFSLFPILLIFLTSLKTDVQTFAVPPVFIFTPTLQNYKDAFIGSWSQFPFVINSLIVTFVSTAISVGFGAMAAYGLARFKFRGSRDLAFWILSTRMAPPIAFIVPMFALMTALRLLDTYWALIIMYTGMNLSFAVWILRGFFLDIPRELEESALVDGYTRWQVFTRIALPLVKPGLAAVAVLSSIFAWNEFLFALILTQQNAKTISIGITGFSTSMGIRWGQFMAVGFVAILPILVFTFILQRYLVRGLTFGAVK
jgi:multiple sugar transport system permease protein